MWHFRIFNINCVLLVKITYCNLSFTSVQKKIDVEQYCLSENILIIILLLSKYETQYVCGLAYHDCLTNTFLFWGGLIFLFIQLRYFMLMLVKDNSQQKQKYFIHLHLNFLHTFRFPIMIYYFSFNSVLLMTTQLKNTIFQGKSLPLYAVTQLCCLFVCFCLLSTFRTDNTQTYTVLK